jgi:predicted phosphodiesterase
MEVDVLVFGHLHRPYVERNEKLLICPGSPTVPRMSSPTVAEIEIKDGKVNGRILPLGEPSCDYIRYAQSLAKKEL